MKRKLTFFLLVFLAGLLLINVPPSFSMPIYEDYSTFTQVDANNRINANSTNINHTAYTNEDAYAYADKGAGFFGDFNHIVDANYYNRSIVEYVESSFWVVSNFLDDARGLYLLKDNIQLNFRSKSNGVLTITLRSRSGSNQYTDAYELATLNTWYYFNITRVSTTATVQIYNDTGRTNLVDTLSVTCPSTAFRYLFGVDTWNNGNARYQTVYAKLLSIGNQYGITFYRSNGGLFRVENSTITNGTTNIYPENTIIELIALVEGNLTYGFNNFTWNGNSSILNPTNYTVTANTTVWCYFETPTTGGYVGFSYLFFGLVLGVVVGGLIFVAKEKS